MAGTYDTEEQRIIDRIKCIAFREARDAGATFIVQFNLSPTGGKNLMTNVIAKSLKSETHISDRLWFCDWLKDWTEEGFLHLAPCNEFFV